MALDFPNAPINGQVYTAPSGEQWIYEAATNSWTSKGLVNTTGGLQYKGDVDITAAPPTGVTSGSQYSVNPGGTANAGYGPGVTGTITKGSMLMYTGTGWIETSHSVPEATSKVKGIDTRKWDRTGTILSPTTAGDVVSISAGTAALPGLTPVGDPNTGIYSPGADQVAVATAGTQRISIADDGDINIDGGGVFYDATTNRLGIGTTTVDDTFEVSGSAIIGKTGTASQIRFRRPNDGSPKGFLGFTDSANASKFELRSEGNTANLRLNANHAAGFLSFDTNNTERLSITHDGYVRLAAGSKGIQFGGDTAAANALDDYEEGTWTPTYGSSSFTSSGITATYPTYTKIGRTVFVKANIVFNGVSGNFAEQDRFIIDGLPFANSLSNTGAVGTIWASADFPSGVAILGTGFIGASAYSGGFTRAMSASTLKRTTVVRIAAVYSA